MAKKANGGNPAKKTSKAKAKAKDKVTVKTKATAKAVKVTEITKAAKTLSPQEVAKIVGEINKLAIDTVERGQMDIGDLVLEKVFQGSLDEATSRNPNKSKSMMQIIADENLRVDRRRLGEWVRAAFVRKELIEQKVDCSNLSYSHFAALLKVEDGKKRKKLAADANKGQWTARMLTAAVDKLKDPAVTEGKAQVPTLPSDMTVGRLLEAAANPRVLMKDKEAQQFLGNPQDLERLEWDVRMQLGKIADELLKCMVGSVDLLKLAKKNIALIELGDPDVIDVEATAV